MGSGLAAHPDSSLGLLLEILWEVIAVTWCVTLPGGSFTWEATLWDKNLGYHSALEPF